MTITSARRRLVLAAVAVATCGIAIGVGAAPASATTTRACTYPDLAVSYSSTNGATGHSTFVLRWRNKTSTPCSLRGYPGFAALDASGHAIDHATDTLSGFTGGASSVQTIVIPPNAHGSARVEYHNFNFGNGHACTFSHSSAAAAPGTGHSSPIPRKVSVCGLEIHPIVHGITGNS